MDMLEGKYCMAATQLKDGRWIVYYVTPSPPPIIKKKYFGRGATAQRRDQELGLRRTRSLLDQDADPLFMALAVEYQNKGASENSKKHLLIRLEANILPAIGDIPAIKISFSDMDRYINSRRKTVKDNTIRREIVDIKAILNWSAKSQRSEVNKSVSLNAN
ncbi:MAG: hypothetical protein V1844_19525 [Pseudomonadota bacterium]